MIEEITKFILKESPGNRIVKTKWVKLVFFINAYLYCKDKDALDASLDFVKMPNGPAFRGYDKIIEDLQRNQILKIEKEPGFSMDMATYLVGSQSAEKSSNTNDPSLYKDYLMVFDYFRDHNTKELSNFSHNLSIWKRPEMWDKLDFEDLKNDPWIAQECPGAKNFMQFIDLQHKEYKK